MRKLSSHRWSRWGCSALFVMIGLASGGCRGDRAGSEQRPAAAPSGPAKAAETPAAPSAPGSVSGPGDHDATGAHEGHDHGEGEGAGAASAPEAEKISTERVVELAQSSIRKMEELSARAAAAKGNCPQLAAALDAFYQENAAFIAEMNGLDEQMTKLQRRLTEEKFTAPMQKAMTALLEQMMSCRDDPAVAKAFLRLQR